MLHWRLKSCARCGGDLFIDKDMDGWFEQCLQCSYRRELKDIKEFKKPKVFTGASPEEVWDETD
jgi:DNA-directed RNA polymerase subunit RPC12/RpoP